MNNLRLFFSKLDKHYYLLDKKDCDGCKSVLRDIGIVKTSFYKNLTEQKCFCLDCWNTKQKKIFNNNDIVRSVFLGSELQKGFVPILDLEPSTLTASREDVVNPFLLNSTITIDRTNHALHGESWEGAQIGADVSGLLEAKDKPLLTKESIKRELLDIFKAKPYVEPSEELDFKKKEGLTYDS
jgi:hypothetical protein